MTQTNADLQNNQEYIDDLCDEVSDGLERLQQFMPWLDDDEMRRLNMQPSGYVNYEAWRERADRMRHCIAQLALLDVYHQFTLVGLGGIQHRDIHVVDKFVYLLERHELKHGNHHR